MTAQMNDTIIPSTHLKVSYKKEMDRSHLFENTDLCCRLFWPLHEHVSVQKTEDLQDLILKKKWQEY